MVVLKYAYFLLSFSMNVVTKELPKSQLELTITVTPEQLQPHLMAAAKKISEGIKIAGFRPGFAPYDVVASQVGEMKILDAALESAVRDTFVEAVRGRELKTVGSPEISIEKAAPKNELVYRAIVSVVPAVKVPDFSKISIKVSVEPVTDAEVNEVIADLQRMHAELQDTTDAVTAQDQVTVDMDLLDGAVPLEGGQARGHIIPLDEPYYIPGFVEKLIGAHAGDELSFELPFPADHYQKLYAGKNITFKVKVTKVQKRTLPEVNDAFAKKLGLESADELRSNITQNIGTDHKRKAEEAADIDMLKAVVNAAEFGELPDNLVDAERRKLMQDLMHSLQQHGIGAEQYFADMKKSPEEIQAGFTDQAIERAKMGLITHTVAIENKLEVTKAELEEELNAIREAYKNNADAIKRLHTPDVQDAVLNSLRNRKVMDWMREKMIPKADA